VGGLHGITSAESSTKQPGLHAFGTLKQERLVFHNPMAGISLSTPVRKPVPLPSDRLRGLLDGLDSPA
jgi:hypothetical protein